MSTDQKEVRIWTLKEGREKQWISSGPWIGRGRTVEVVPLSDYADLQSKVEELEKIIYDEIAEDKYAYSQYCQQMDYNYTKQIETKDAEIAKLREALSKDRLLEVIEDWQMIWRNQNINPEDTKRYRRRALSVDANMRSSLARMISEKALNKGGE